MYFFFARPKKKYQKERAFENISLPHLPAPYFLWTWRSIGCVISQTSEVPAVPAGRQEGYDTNSRQLGDLRWDIEW